MDSRQGLLQPNGIQSLQQTALVTHGWSQRQAAAWAAAVWYSSTCALNRIDFQRKVSGNGGCHGLHGYSDLNNKLHENHIVFYDRLCSQQRSGIQPDTAIVTQSVCTTTSYSNCDLLVLTVQLFQHNQAKKDTVGAKPC